MDSNVERFNFKSLPAFSGKAGDFTMWWFKFKAIATLLGFAASLQKNSDGTYGEKECPKDASAASVLMEKSRPTAADKVALAAWKRNCHAFSALTMCFPDSLFEIVVGADGLASVAVKSLMDRFMPNDRITAIEANRKYAAMSLAHAANPRTLETRFAQLATEYPGYKKPDDDLITIILDIAPERYQTLIATTIQRYGSALTSKILIDELVNFWRQCGGGSSHPETALGAPEYRDSNNGGNNATSSGNDNCTGDSNGTNSNQSNTRNAQVCSECGLRGHSRERCFCLPANAWRRPSGWTPPDGYTGTEVSSSAIDSGGGHEFFLSHLDSFGDMHLNDSVRTILLKPDIWIGDTGASQHITGPFGDMHLNDSVRTILLKPDIWIGDTGASQHITGHSEGFTNPVANHNSKGIIDHVGKSFAHKFYGDLPVRSTTLRDVAYNPNASFNLLSCTKLLDMGWTMSASSDGMIMQGPDGDTLNFNIRIETQRGVVFAVRLKRNHLATVPIIAPGNKTISTVAVGNKPCESKLSFAVPADTCNRHSEVFTPHTVEFEEAVRTENCNQFSVPICKPNCYTHYARSRLSERLSGISWITFDEHVSVFCTDERIEASYTVEFEEAVWI